MHRECTQCDHYPGETGTEPAIHYPPGAGSRLLQSIHGGRKTAEQLAKPGMGCIVSSLSLSLKKKSATAITNCRWGEDVISGFFFRAEIVQQEFNSDVKS